MSGETHGVPTVGVRQLPLIAGNVNTNTITPKHEKKYVGIGELLIAQGIKLSIDYGCDGTVMFEAKTDELAYHYERDFHAKRVFSLNSGGPKRYMLADSEAREIFVKFLKEDEV